MVDADGLGVADELDVIDGLHPRHVAVKDKKLEGFGVGDPQKICLGVVEEVADLRDAGRYLSELFLPLLGSAQGIAPQRRTALGPYI